MDSNKNNSILGGLTYTAPSWLGSFTQTKPTAEPKTTEPLIIAPSRAYENKNSYKSFIDEQRQQIQNQSSNVNTQNVIKEEKDRLNADAEAKKLAEDAKQKLEERKVNFMTSENGNVSDVKFGIDTGKMPTGETKTVKDTKGNTYIIDSNGQIVSGASDGDYKVGSNISAYSSLYKEITGGSPTSAGYMNSTDSYVSERNTIQDKIDEATDKWNELSNKLVQGTFPLNDFQKAQLTEMENDFKSLIEETKRANAMREGILKAEGTLRSEYTPGMEADNMKYVIDKGIADVAKIEVKMRSALASLEQGFQEDNYKMMNEAYKTFVSAQKDKQAHLDKVQEEIQNTLKQVSSVNKAVSDFQNETLKSASEAGAPADVLTAIQNATTPAEMVSAAGQYMIKGSGIIGEYNYYKADSLSRGEVPITFDEYQTIDTNRKIATASASAFANGLTTAQSNLINTQNTFLSGQPVAKDLSTIQSKFANLLQAVKQGGGAADIGMIYDFMKSLDPNSVVRETEYETGAKKSGNIFAGTFAKYNGYLNPKGGFISETAKVEILKAINARYETALADYRNVRNQVVNRLEKQGIVDANEYVVDYDRSKEIFTESSFSDQDFALYLKMNPEQESMALEIKRQAPELSNFEIWQLLEQ